MPLITTDFHHLAGTGRNLAIVEPIERPARENMAHLLIFVMMARNHRSFFEIEQGSRHTLTVHDTTDNQRSELLALSTIPRMDFHHSRERSRNPNSPV